MPSITDTKNALLLGDILVNTINGKPIPASLVYTTRMSPHTAGKLTIQKALFQSECPFSFQVFLKSEDGNTLNEIFPDVSWTISQLVLDFGQYFSEEIVIVYTGNL